jgi:hypothetical protein
MKCKICKRRAEYVYIGEEGYQFFRCKDCKAIYYDKHVLVLDGPRTQVMGAVVIMICVVLSIVGEIMNTSGIRDAVGALIGLLIALAIAYVEGKVYAFNPEDLINKR